MLQLPTTLEALLKFKEWQCLLKSWNKIVFATTTCGQNWQLYILWPHHIVEDIFATVSYISLLWKLVSLYQTIGYDPPIRFSPIQGQEAPR